MIALRIVLSASTLGSLLVACSTSSVSLPGGLNGNGTDACVTIATEGSDDTLSDDEPSGSSGITPSGAAESTGEFCGPIIHGIATYYVEADGTGNCSFPKLNNPKPLVVAPNKQRWYNGSAACGECLEVTGPKGSVVVLVVDSCPIDTPYNDCGNTGADLDLSPAAFEAIEDLKVGKTAVTFQVVPCNVAGPMQYQFKDGSSQWWTAIQVRNHRHPIKTVDYLDDKGHWTNMPRADYNYFIESGGVGARPHGLSLRITSIYGQVVEDTVNVAVGGSALDSKTAFPGTQQFD